MAKTGITSILSSNDLLRMIFQGLKPMYLSQETQDSLNPTQLGVFASSRRRAQCHLASAARVCRAFSEHALDALWEVIQSVVPLLHVLPSVHDLSSPLDILPIFTLERWDRLQSYARRVKELHHKCSSLDCVCSSIFPILLSKSCGIPLFPRLKQLKILCLDGETAPYMIPLLSSTLKSITMAFDKDNGTKDWDNFETILCALHVTSPDIRELVLLDKDRFRFSLGEQHIKSLSNFPRLRRFTSRLPLDPAAWQTVGTLPSIQHLDITIHDWGANPGTSSLVLPDLQSLTLRGTLLVLTDFLRRSSLPVLRSASFHVGDFTSPTPVTLKNFFILAKERLPSALRHFTLRCVLVTRPNGSHPGDNSKLLLDLKPLAAFTELEELHIDLGGATVVHVSDREIRTLAKALPCLVSLTLRCNPGPFDGLRQRPTVASLVTLARHCPRLACLHLSDLDMDPDVGQDSAEKGCSSKAKLLTVPALDHKLRELEILFFRAKTREVFEFAEKVDRLFPHLVNVRSQDMPTESRAAGASDCMWSPWDVAKTCVGYLQNARRNNLGRSPSLTTSKSLVAV